MEGMHRFGNLPDPLIQIFPISRQGGQSTFFGKSSHDHHVVDRLSTEFHVGDPQVHVRGEPSVQIYFASTVLVAGRSVPEVEESELNMLSELVHPIIDEEQNGNVCLDNSRTSGPLRAHDHSPERRTLIWGTRSRGSLSRQVPVIERRYGEKGECDTDGDHRAAADPVGAYSRCGVQLVEDRAVEQQVIRIDDPTEKLDEK
jgi:hypothetical protein